MSGATPDPPAHPRAPGPAGPTGDEVIELLGLEPLPAEGGWFRETFRDEASTAIVFLLRAGECSRLHRLTSPEVYHWYGGAPLRLTVLHEDGRVEEAVLGGDLLAGLRPQHVVPAGACQGSEPLGPWTLVGTTMAPGFTWEGFELVDRSEALRRWPSAAERIVRLT